MRSPYVVGVTDKRRPASTKSINDVNQGVLTLELPMHVLVKLKIWIEGRRVSKIIWIEGTSPFFNQSKHTLPRRERYQNPNSSLPRWIFSSCDPKHNSATEIQSQKSSSNEELTLLSLLDSIITQLQGILPLHTFSTLGLLDQSKKSASVALQMIQAFLEYVKAPSLVWVIDGLQLAESPGTNHSLSELVWILRARGSKICFTTCGKSDVLSKLTCQCERVNASNVLGRNERPI